MGRMRLPPTRGPHETFKGGGTQLPVVWMQHAPSGRQLQQARRPSESSVGALVSAGAIPVLPVACRLPGHPKADALGLRWLRRYLRVAASGRLDAGVPFPDLRTPGGFHPSLLHVTAAGVVAVPRSALLGGEDNEHDKLNDESSGQNEGSHDLISCIVATVQRPKPWWAALPAWAVRGFVNEPGLFAHESLFLTGPVTRYAEEGVQPSAGAAAAWGPVPARIGSSRQDETEEKPVKGGGGVKHTQQGRLARWKQAALTAGHTASAAVVSPMASALRRVRPSASSGTAVAPPAASKPKPAAGRGNGSVDSSNEGLERAPAPAPARAQTAKVGLLRRALQAAKELPGSVWGRVPRISWRKKDHGIPRSKAVYSAPRGFSVPTPPPEKQGVLARMLTLRRAPPAHTMLPPHPDGLLATSMEHVQRPSHPRDVLFCLGTVSLGAHLARHGAAVADTTLTLQLTAESPDGNNGEGSMQRVELQWAAPVHALAAAVGDTEAAQTAAAAHGVGVWADEEFAAQLAQSLDDEQR